MPALPEKNVVEKYKVGLEGRRDAPEQPLVGLRRGVVLASGHTRAAGFQRGAGCTLHQPQIIHLKAASHAPLACPSPSRQMTTDFIETRRAALAIFINRVVCPAPSVEWGGRICCTWGPAHRCPRLPAAPCPSQPAPPAHPRAPLQAAHPALKASPDLQLFLEASETEFAIEVSRSQADEPPASTPQARAEGGGRAQARPARRRAAAGGGRLPL